MKGDTDVVQSVPAGEVLHAQAFGTAGLIVTLKHVPDRTTHHHPDQIIHRHFVDGSSSNQLTIAQHGDPVTHLLYFLETVRDVDDPNPLRIQLVYGCKELFRFPLGEGGGWVGHDEDL